MSNSNFNTVSPNQTPLDPSKRVKYSMGLVLGVEEFEQEQYYLMERDRIHQRALHGYGTAVGLKVEFKKDDGVPNVLVSPGIAVNPRGDTICVPQSQCADLDGWLEENSGEMETQLDGAVSGTAALYVVLCYKECPTDNVPIPGAPCRSKEDILAPSRIADYFDLSITTTPPDQVEEEYVRCFGKFLRHIEISKYAPDPKSKEEMVAKVKELFGGMGSLLECPFDGEESPSDDDKYYISPDNAPEILEAVFRVWVTEIRPVLLHKAGVCGGVSGSPEAPGSCVLLSQLNVAVKKTGNTWKFDGAVTGGDVIEDRRPMLLHTRLLQEWLLFGGYGSIKPDTHTFVSLTVKLPKKILLWVHHPELLVIKEEDIIVVISGIEIPKIKIVNIDNTNIFNIILPGALKEKSRIKVGFNVTQIKLKSGPDSGKTLAEVLHKPDYIYLDREGDWLWSYVYFSIPRLDDLFDVNVTGPDPDQILTWDSGTKKWIATDKPVVITDHGELSGREDDDHDHYLNETRAIAWGDPRYAPRIHSHPLNGLTDVNVAGLAGGNILKWNSGQNTWMAGPPPSGGISLQDIAEKLPLLPFVSIETTGGPVNNEDGVWLPFQLWFHLNTDTGKKPRINKVVMNVYYENREDKACAVKELVFKNLTIVKDKCNVVRFLLNLDELIKLEETEAFLRFVFNLEKTTFKKDSDSVPLIEWITKQKLKWIGHNGAGTVTAFYSYSPSGTGKVQTGYDIVAGGTFNSKGKPDKSKPPLNGLTASPLTKTAFGIQYILKFPGFVPGNNYITKGTPLVKTGIGQGMIFLVDGSPREDGILAELIGFDNMPSNFSFMVEIGEILNNNRG